MNSEKYTKSDEVSLNARGWVGINTNYITEINSTIKYFRFHDPEFKKIWQLFLTIVSISKTLFLTLNNHFEWIKPWNKILVTANIVPTWVIFFLK